MGCSRNSAIPVAGTGKPKNYQIMSIGLPTGGAVTMLWQGGALWQKAMTSSS